MFSIIIHYTIYRQIDILRNYLKYINKKQLYIIPINKEFNRISTAISSFNKVQNFVLFLLKKYFYTQIQIYVNVVILIEIEILNIVYVFVVQLTT